MAQLDTGMGGSKDAFPETAWSSILTCPEAASAARRERLETLIRRYWRPVYKFIRTGWSKSIEDAKDLTQEFFSGLLGADGLAGYEPRQGRFRHYLKGAIKNFLTNDRRRNQAEKRGGGRASMPLDVEGLETEKFAAERASLTPEQIFDRQWAQEHLAAGLAKLEKAMNDEGAGLRFKVFEAYALRRSAGSRATYEEIAATFGIGVWDVKNHLTEVRTRLDSLLVESISDSVTTREELIQEMAELFSG